MNLLLINSETGYTYDVDGFGNCPNCGAEQFSFLITTKQLVLTFRKSEIVSVFADCKSKTCSTNDLPAVMAIILLLQYTVISLDFKSLHYRLYANLTLDEKLEISLERSQPNQT